MATAKQIELFSRLTQQRNFAGQNVEALKTQFATLTDTNASAWIERALDLPKLTSDEEAATFVAPTF